MADTITYTIKGPDGRTYSIEGPPGATREQVIDAIRHKNQDAGRPGAGYLNQLALGAVSGGAQFLEMLPQLPAAQFGPTAMEAVRRFTPDVQKIFGVKRGEGGPLDPQGFGESAARTAGEFLGNPTTYIGGAGGIRGLIAKAADAVLAAVGAEGAHQLAHAAHFGPVGDAVSQLAGALVLPGARSKLAGGAQHFDVDPQHQEMVDRLREKHGIEPTAGDVMQSTSLRRSETTLGALPGAAGAAKREDTRVGNEVSNAVLRLMGDTTTDMKDPSARFGTALLANKTRLAADFEFAADAGKVQLDKDWNTQMRALLQEAYDEGLNEDQMRRLNALVRGVTDRALTGGLTTALGGRSRKPPTGLPEINGAQYQTLTKDESPLARAIESNDSDLAYYATRIRSGIDDAMQRTIDRKIASAYARGKAGGPAQAEAQELALAQEVLKTARGQWYTMLVAVKAFGSTGAAARHGRLSPQRLAAILNAGDDNKMRNAFERSNLRELAQDASGVISNLANSSTAERGLMVAAAENIGQRAAHAFSGAEPARGNIFTAGAVGGFYLGGIPGAAIGMLTPGLTGKALLSPKVQAWLKRRRPEGAGTSGRGIAATAAQRAETEISPPGGEATPIAQAHAAEGPRLPGQLGPVRPEAPGEGGGMGGPGAPTPSQLGRGKFLRRLDKVLQEHPEFKQVPWEEESAQPPVVENPDRASVPPRYRESAPNAKYYQPWTQEELDMAKAGQVPPGRTMNQMHRQRQLKGWAKPRVPEPVPEESEPGFSQRAIEAPAPVPGDARARRVVPRIVVRPEGAGQLPGDISTTEDVLANPEDDPLQ